MTRAPGDPGLFRRLARLLVRGPEAPYILTDLDDAFDNDVARGLPLRRARWRYVVNAVASAGSVWLERLRPSAFRLSLVDVKLGLRMLVKYPGLTSVALIALAVGIPVGLAPAHLASALEAPMPVNEGARLRLLRYWDLNAGHTRPTTFEDYRRWRDALTSFETLGAARTASYNLDPGNGQTAPVAGAEVTASTFALLRTPPLLGRTFVAADEVPGAPVAAIIGHELWRGRFEGDAAVVGREIRLAGVPCTVIGVMPEGFRFPIRQQLWLPMRDRVSAGPDDGRPLSIIGRLADGVPVEQAEADLAAVWRATAVDSRPSDERLVPEVVPTAFMVMGGLPKGGFRALPEFTLVRALTLLPLLVACVNVGLMIFARTASRTTEFAVRTALGASRARILTQVFTESLVLAVLAAGLGLLLIGVLLRSPMTAAMERLGTGEAALAWWIDPSLTGATVLWGLALAGLSAVIAGVLPALRVTRRSLQQTLQRGPARLSGVRVGGLSGALIAVDVAVAVAVVGFSVALADKARDTMRNGEAVGIDASRFLAAELRLSALAPDGGVTDRIAFRTRMAATQEALVERLRAEPGVRAVAAGSALPRMDHAIGFVEVEGEALPVGARGRRVRTARVGVGFFDALGHPVLAGRRFTAADLEEGAPAVIVNTTFVKRLLDDRNPIGLRVRYRSGGGEAPGPWHEIVGVVGHLGMHVLTPEQDEGIYHPLAPGAIHPVRLAIEVGDDPERFTPRLRALAGEVDPHAVIAGPTALDRVYEGDSYLIAAMAAGSVLLIGVLLTLAASGIYAIMSFTVAARTREIGIRVALGADPFSIAFHVARRAMIQLGIGVLLGLPIGARIFFELQADAGRDPSAILTTLLALVPGVGVMVLVGLIACAAPTRRALRISPVEALKQE